MQLEAELSNHFEEYDHASIAFRYDSLSPILKKKIEQLLSEAESFHYPFEKLGKHLNIIHSRDNRLRIFSWDERTGGSMHDMAAIVQYQTASKQIKTYWLDSPSIGKEGARFNEVYFEIHNLQINGQLYYLCFGWGTYGSGNHHNTILIFSLEEEQLQLCDACIDRNYQLIMAPRMYKIELQFDENQQEISFNEFKEDEETGFFQSTGKRIRLKLKGNKFMSD